MIQSNKIKLVVLISSYSIGGYETRLQTILSRLDMNRFDVTLLQIYPEYKGKKDASADYRNPFEKLLGTVRIETISMKSRFDLTVFPKTMKHVGKANILFFFAIGPITFLAPFVGMWFRKLKIIRVAGTILDGLYPVWLRPLDWLGICFTHTIVAPSRFIQDLYMRSLKINQNKIKVIPNGIDLRRFGSGKLSDDIRKELDLTESDRIVGMVANLAPLKGHRLFLEMIPLLLQKQHNIHFLIVGEGQLREELEKLTGHLSLQHVVHFLGFRDDVPVLMSNFDVGILCSDVETFGNALIEMMASSVPVVATRVGAIPEIIDDGVSGLLVEHGDVRALSEAVDTLLTDKKMADSFRKKGKALVEERYSNEQMVNRLESLFISIVKNQ